MATPHIFKYTDRHTHNIHNFYQLFCGHENACVFSHRFIHNNVRLTPGGSCVQNETGGGTERFKKSAQRDPRKREKRDFLLLAKYKRVKHKLKPAYREAHFSRLSIIKKIGPSLHISSLEGNTKKCTYICILLYNMDNLWILASCHLGKSEAFCTICVGWRAASPSYHATTSRPGRILHSYWYLFSNTHKVAG